MTKVFGAYRNKKLIKTTVQSRTDIQKNVYTKKCFPKFWYLEINNCSLQLKSNKNVCVGGTIYFSNKIDFFRLKSFQRSDRGEARGSSFIYFLWSQCFFFANFKAFAIEKAKNKCEWVTKDFHESVKRICGWQLNFVWLALFFLLFSSPIGNEDGRQKADWVHWQKTKLLFGFYFTADKHINIAIIEGMNATKCRSNNNMK